MGVQAKNNSIQVKKRICKRTKQIETIETIWSLAAFWLALLLWMRYNGETYERVQFSLSIELANCDLN